MDQMERDWKDELAIVSNCFTLFFGNAEKAASPCSLLPIDFQGKRSPKDHKQKLATTRCLKVVDFGNSRVLEVASGGNSRALPEQEVSVFDDLGHIPTASNIGKCPAGAAAFNYSWHCCR